MAKRSPSKDRRAGRLVVPASEPISEKVRWALMRRLIEVLGEEEAETLMESLPPVAWSQIATKDDLGELEKRLMSAMDTRFTEFRKRVHRVQIGDQRRVHRVQVGDQRRVHRFQVGDQGRARRSKGRMEDRTCPQYPHGGAQLCRGNGGHAGRHGGHHGCPGPNRGPRRLSTPATPTTPSPTPTASPIPNPYPPPIGNGRFQSFQRAYISSRRK